MFGFTIIRKKELQKLELREKALLIQVESIANERNEAQLRNEIAQKELERYRPRRDESGKFLKRTN